MRFLMAGAGAVGGLYGALLARAGHEVVFLARGENLKILRKKGFRVKSIIGNFHLKVRAYEKPPKGETFDTIFICVKDYQTEKLLPQLKKSVGDETLVISLQNGVEQHVPLVKTFGKKHVAAGLTYVGVRLQAPGVIHHVAAGKITVGELQKGSAKRLKELVGVLRKSGIDAQLVRDIRVPLWEKLVWNVGFNGTSALLDVSVGELLKRPEQQKLIYNLRHEVVAVARKSGIKLRKNLPELFLKYSVKEFSSIETSMFWDRRLGRPLEWKIFQGFISKKGRRLGVPTPANDFIGGLLEALSPVG